jgi:ornithine decarboxylase
MSTAQLIARSPQRIFDFIDRKSLPTPYLVMDLLEIEHSYQALVAQLPDTQIYYAVKANPAPAILQLLVKLGASFDAASLPEIQACLDAGAQPHQISFGNTIKKAADIATAHRLGIRLFAFDSLPELEKLAEHAPGAKIYCRLLMACTGAEWPLSRKFGCELDMAKDLLIHSDRLGLQAYGVSFHVGSQQLDVRQWDLAIATTARLFRDLAAVGVELQMLNLGGGFPARYRNSVPEPP